MRVKKAKPRVPGAWKPVFLEALANTGNIRLSASAANISRQMVYKARGTDAKFAEAFDDAIDHAMDVLERECWRRAVAGVSRKRSIRLGSDPKTNRAMYEVVVEQEYSDNLLMFLLKGYRPERFRDNFDVQKLVGALVNANANAQEPPNVGLARTPKAPRPKRPA